MTVMRARTRLVYFRVSEDEYAWLHQMCEQTGARSLSDLVRTFLKERREGGNGGVEELRERIEKLTVLMQKLEERLEGDGAVKARGGM
ncbi:MAG: hypothetical protein WHT08_14180 [Bryobacteraceae bacterium]